MGGLDKEVSDPFRLSSGPGRSPETGDVDSGLIFNRPQNLGCLVLSYCELT